VRKWALLAGAILSEVAAALALRAFLDNPIWAVLVVSGYLVTFLCLTLLLRAGMPIGVAYGIWGASGTALTAVLAAIIFHDPFTAPVVLGIGFIVVGVLLVQFGWQRAQAKAADGATP
jgi:small multidrug resistance pump